MYGPSWIIDVVRNCSMFLNVIINLNKEKQQRLRSLEESENVALSLQSLCAHGKKIKHPELFFSLDFSFVYLWIWMRERDREEKGKGGSESPYVHWRQPEACVYLTAFRAQMIRGSEPNTFIRTLRRDRSWGTAHRRIKMLWTKKRWNNLF